MTRHTDEIPHILVVTGSEGEVEYEVRHLPECETYDHLNGHVINCGVEYVMDELGTPDCFTRSEQHLPPGIYEVRFDHMEFPSTPNGPAEYDAWLDVERVDG